MSRLTLTDNTMSMTLKMSDGNPGAVSAIMDIIEKHDAIDPQAAMGGLGAIMMLDTWEIYGTAIYVLYSDKCGRDVRKMLMIMRATQMGLFSRDRLQQMAADQMRSVNLDDEEWYALDEKVCGQLEDFAKAV